MVFILSPLTGFFDPRVTHVRVYSSVTGDWGKPISVQHPDLSIDRMPSPSPLVGDKLYFICGCKNAFEYVLGAQRLSIIELEEPPLPIYRGVLMSMEDGGLGSMDVEKEPTWCLLLWSRKPTPEGDGGAQWERSRVTGLETLLLDGAMQDPQLPSRNPIVELFGFAEGTGCPLCGHKGR